jgi:acetyl-CoA carboxylase carboxyltransferase component
MDAIADPAAREAYFNEAVARMRAHGKALNMAMHLEIDAVIDPADTRANILRLIGTLPARRNGNATQGPFLDSW